MKQFRWLTALVVGAFLLAACGGMQAAGPDGDVALAIVTENPTVLDPHQSGNAVFECAAVGEFQYAYKIDNWSEIATMNGTYTSQGVTFTITNDDKDAKTFDWSATAPISAVIVKGGPGANLWSYDPAVTSDTGLYAPPNAGVSHVTFCWNDGDIDIEDLIEVEKTVVTTYTRTHKWDIAKKVETDNELELEDGTPKIWLYIDGTGDETATWTVDVSYEGYEDSGWNVSGVITVLHSGFADTPVVVTGVTDFLGVTEILAGAEIAVDCDLSGFDVSETELAEFPVTLSQGDSFTCTYSEDGFVEGFNVATAYARFADQADEDAVPVESDKMPIVWGDPTTEINKTVNITDDSDLSDDPVDLGTVTAPDNGQFTYVNDFAWEDYGQDLCGSYAYANTAKIVETNQTAEALLKVNVQCYLWESAWAMGAGEDVDAKAFCDNGFNNWGWTNEIGQPYVGSWPLYAGAGQCDTTKGELVGYFKVDYIDGFEFTFVPNAGVLFDDAAVYAGTGMFPLQRNGNPTTAPGQYTIADPLTGVIHVIAHVNAGVPDPDFGP